jgi:hypothetical protein
MAGSDRGRDGWPEPYDYQETHHREATYGAAFPGTFTLSLCHRDLHATTLEFRLASPGAGQSVLGRQHRARTRRGQHGAADCSGVLALDRCVPRRRGFRLAVPETGRTCPPAPLAHDASALRDRHRHLQHNVLHRPGQHHCTQRAAAAVGRTADYHRLGVRAVRRASKPVADRRRPAVADRRRNDRGTGVAYNIVPTTDQPRRRMGSRGDDHLRHLRGGLPDSSSGASDEFLGRHDGHRLADDLAVLCLGNRPGRPHRRHPLHLAGNGLHRRVPLTSPTCSSIAASN